ncbi:MAG: lysine exporter LysO family protein [Thermotogae bacterium]|nr:lysine exporter LysO family protein [Thermotogota bacterium]
MIQMILAVVIGIVLGRLVKFEIPDWTFTILLMFLVFIVGVDIGSEEKILSKIKSNLGKMFIQGFLTIAGSLFGAIFVSFITDLSLKESIGAAAGLGWYSLSGIMITNLYSPLLGAISFTSNVLRELLSIVIIPFLSMITPLGAISAAGATSMDTLLGLISKCTSKEETLIAFGQGVIITALVPLLIIFIFS